MPSWHTWSPIPGDGIGPEVAEAALRVLDATGAGIEWEVEEAGATALENRVPSIGDVRTPDFGGTSTTTEVAGSIVSALGG